MLPDATYELLPELLQDPPGQELIQLAPLRQMEPATSSFPAGAVVPIPTLPDTASPLVGAAVPVE